jgi:single-strand DNA-binding protein
MANPTVVLIGRVGTEPESVGSNGLRFRVATSDRVKNEETGQWEDKNTSWWTIKAWRSVAEYSKDVIKKGMEVTIIGKIYEESWTDRDGEKRTSFEINAESIAVTAFSLAKNKTSDNDDFPSYKKYSEIPF